MVPVWFLKLLDKLLKLKIVRHSTPKFSIKLKLYEKFWSRTGSIKLIKIPNKRKKTAVEKLDLKKIIRQRE